MEDRIWYRGSWVREEMREEVRYEFGLDADTCPAKWQPNPSGWEVAKRAEGLVDDVLAFMGSGYQRPFARAEDLASLRSERISLVVSEVPNSLGQLRAAAMKAQMKIRRERGESPPEQAVAAEPPPTLKGRFTLHDLPAEQLLERLVLLEMDEEEGKALEANGGFTRVLDLALLPPHQNRLPDPVGAYRKLAVDAYVNADIAATITFCRSALESMIKKVLAAREIFLADASMKDKVRAATLCGSLDPALEKAARKVWYRGFKTLYQDPGVVRDALGTLRSMIVVLEDLRARLEGCD